MLVMVSDDPAELARTAARAGLRRVQPHGPRRAEVAAALLKEGFEVLLPWLLTKPVSHRWRAALTLGARPGRTGLEAARAEANPLAHPPPGPFLLAGGLDGGNLAGLAAVLPAESRPHLRGFDAASRLEQSPGVKSAEKVRAFIRAARTLDLGGTHAL